MNNKVIDLFDNIKCVSNSLHLNKIFNMLYKFVLNPVYIIFIKPIAKMFVFMFIIIIIIKFTIFVF